MIFKTENLRDLCFLKTIWILQRPNVLLRTFCLMFCPDLKGKEKEGRVLGFLSSS